MQRRQTMSRSNKIDYSSCNRMQGRGASRRALGLFELRPSRGWANRNTLNMIVAFALRNGLTNARGGASASPCPLSSIMKAAHAAWSHGAKHVRTCFSWPCEGKALKRISRVSSKKVQAAKTSFICVKGKCAFGKSPQVQCNSSLDSGVSSLER